MRETADNDNPLEIAHAHLVGPRTCPHQSPLPAATCAAEAQQVAMRLRATSGMPDALVDTLVALFEPRTYNIAPDEKTMDVVTRVCGSVTDHYLSEMDKRNPTWRSGKFDPGTPLVVLPCLRVQANARYGVDGTKDAAAIVQDLLGVAPDDLVFSETFVLAAEVDNLLSKRLDHLIVGGSTGEHVQPLAGSNVLATLFSNFNRHSETTNDTLPVRHEMPHRNHLAMRTALFRILLWLQSTRHSEQLVRCIPERKRGRLIEEQ